MTQQRLEHPTKKYLSIGIPDQPTNGEHIFPPGQTWKIQRRDGNIKVQPFLLRPDHLNQRLPSRARQGEKPIGGKVFSKGLPQEKAEVLELPSSLMILKVDCEKSVQRKNVERYKWSLSRRLQWNQGVYGGTLRSCYACFFSKYIKLWNGTLTSLKIQLLPQIPRFLYAQNLEP